jgi:hypothetical protein
MILNLFILLIVQPFLPSVFLFLAPVLNYFFKNKIKELIFYLIFFSFISDLIFIKTLGFFLLITSFTLFLITFLEKFFDHYYFYQKFIYLFLFNIIFCFIFFFFSFEKFTFSFLFIKFVFLNIIFQLIYILVDNFLKIRRK